MTTTARGQERQRRHRAEDWLLGLVRPDARPWSERAAAALPTVRALLAALGDPQRDLRVVHLAGSKGKGSTALMVEAILERAGVRTGVFVSPHLERWTERIRIDGAEIPMDTLAETLATVRPHVDRQMRASPERMPGFFDALTAAAFLLFADRRVDVAVVETGIGGRFDATRAARPAVACVTTVEREHTDKLGTRLDAIARHKAGILVSGATAVIGTLPPAAARVVDARLARLDIPALRLGHEIEATIRAGAGAHGSRLRYRCGSLGLEASIGPPGRSMAQNAALAIACVQALGVVPDRGLRDAASALEDVHLPGRCEVLGRAPWIVVDAAHTPGSIAALGECLDALPCRERHLLVSVTRDKDPLRVLGRLLATAASVTATAPEPLRSMPAGMLAARLREARPGLDVVEDADAARCAARLARRLSPESLLCATGSTYVAGAARRGILSPT